MVRYNADTIVAALTAAGAATPAARDGENDDCHRAALRACSPGTPLPAVAMRDLTVAYRDTPVLWDVDLDIPPVR